MVMGVLVITAYTVNSRNNSNYLSNFQKFLFCEQGSHISSNPCINSGHEGFGLMFIQMLSGVLLGFLPLVNMVYVVNIQELKDLWKKHSRSIVCKHY